MDTLTFEYEMEFEHDCHASEEDGCTCDPKELGVVVDYTYSVDSCYGADADGNRGERVVMLDDVKVKIFDAGKDVTKILKSEYKDEYMEILEIAEEKAQYAAYEADIEGR